MHPVKSLPTLADLPEEALDGKPVFVRVDFNVPMDGDAVADATRIEAALPTLRALLERGALCVLGSHRGRPKGEPDAALSLRPVASALEELLGEPVAFSKDCIGAVAETAVAELGRRSSGADSKPAARVLLLENLRFHAGEKANDAEFVAALSKLSSTYVNDAFGTAHRAHASTAGLAQRAEWRAAGLLLSKEVEILGGMLQDPERPFFAALGGAKISGKLETMRHLAESVDVLAVGGGMANTLLLAKGVAMGASLVEEDLVPVAKQILRRCAERSVELLLPEDLVVTDDLDASHGENTDPLIRAVDSEGLQHDEMAVDVGPKTRARFAAAVEGAATVFWNGPMGVFEKPPFDAGSVALAKALGRCSGFTAVGGGETVAAINAAGAAAGIDHISTGGGASLELLAGKELPGVVALSSDT